MNGGSHPYKPYHFLKQCNDKFQMHINNKLKFLAEVRTKLEKKKLHSFGQFNNS